MRYTRDEVIRLGGSLSAFFGGHVASISIKAAECPNWTCSSQPTDSNGESLRRVLTAALCWLDGYDAMIEPALRGDIRMKPERRRSYEDQS